MFILSEIRRDIYRSLTFSSPTVLFALAGDLIMFLSESADSWISVGQSVDCVVSTKEVQALGLTIVCPLSFYVSHWGSGHA